MKKFLALVLFLPASCCPVCPDCDLPPLTPRDFQVKSLGCLGYDNGPDQIYLSVGASWTDNSDNEAGFTLEWADVYKRPFVYNKIELDRDTVSWHDNMTFERQAGLDIVLIQWRLTAHNKNGKAMTDQIEFLPFDHLDTCRARR